MRTPHWNSRAMLVGRKKKHTFRLLHDFPGPVPQSPRAAADISKTNLLWRPVGDISKISGDITFLRSWIPSFSSFNEKKHFLCIKKKALKMQKRRRTWKLLSMLFVFWLGKGELCKAGGYVVSRGQQSCKFWALERGTKRFGPFPFFDLMSLAKVLSILLIFSKRGWRCQENYHLHSCHWLLCLCAPVPEKISIQAVCKCFWCPARLHKQASSWEPHSGLPRSLDNLCPLAEHHQEHASRSSCNHSVLQGNPWASTVNYTNRQGNYIGPLWLSKMNISLP